MPNGKSIVGLDDEGFQAWVTTTYPNIDTRTLSENVWTLLYQHYTGYLKPDTPSEASYEGQQQPVLPWKEVGSDYSAEMEETLGWQKNLGGLKEKDRIDEFINWIEKYTTSEQRGQFNYDTLKHNYQNIWLPAYIAATKKAFKDYLSRLVLVGQLTQKYADFYKEDAFAHLDVRDAPGPGEYEGQRNPNFTEFDRLVSFHKPKPSLGTGPTPWKDPFTGQVHKPKYQKEMEQWVQKSMDRGVMTQQEAAYQLAATRAYLEGKEFYPPSVGKFKSARQKADEQQRYIIRKAQEEALKRGAVADLPTRREFDVRRDFPFEEEFRGQLAEFEGSRPWKDWFERSFPSMVNKFLNIEGERGGSLTGAQRKRRIEKLEPRWSDYLTEAKKEYWRLSPAERGEKPWAYAPRVRSVDY